MNEVTLKKYILIDEEVFKEFKINSIRNNFNIHQQVTKLLHEYNLSQIKDKYKEIGEV